MELAELIRGAQEAMDRGDFAITIAACSHALDAYPSCMTVHRLAGEAHLERGESESAVVHFERTLEFDPLSVVARLGLGVAAEERKDPGLAYAHYLHAWEINPALDQVRDQLARLRGLLGNQDRLHPTRAGLAGIHARSGQFGRAAAEWRAILAVDPQSSRARTALAEVLWRAGDDVGAAAICRDVLQANAENSRALVMLADIEHRLGSAAAKELTERYGAVDPLAEMANHLFDLREGIDLAFLLTDSPTIPDFDFAAAAQRATPDVLPTPTPTTSHVAAPDLWDNLVRDLQPGANGVAKADDAILPFSWSDEAGDLAPVEDVDPFSMENLDRVVEPRLEPAELVAAAAGASDRLTAVAQTASVADQDASPPRTSVTAVVDAPPPPAPPVLNADPFVTADGRVDLTIGWDDLDRTLREATPSGGAASGFESLLAELDAGGVAPFAAVDAGGDLAWAPFSVDELGGDPTESTAAPMPAPDWPADLSGGLPSDDASLPLGSDLEPFAAEADEVVGSGWTAAADSHASDFWKESEEALPDDWVAIDEDLIAAIPSQQSSGYTDLLRHVDNERPLAFDPAAEAAPVDPFENPDLAGDPLDVEALLLVTSRDSTGPLVATAGHQPRAAASFEDLDALIAASPDVVAAPSASNLAPNELQALVDELGGVEPFLFDDPSGMAPSADARGDDFRGFDAPVELPEIDLGVALFDVEAHDGVLIDEALIDAASAVAMLEPAVALEAAAEPVAADAFDSDLHGQGGLFARLRSAKTDLVNVGRVVVDRSLRPAPASEPAVIDRAAEQEAPAPAKVALTSIPGGRAPRSATLEQELAAMRQRLMESDEAAAEIAATLETAVLRDEPDPLEFRVLGEAYLRLGRTDQAAAQFLQAMLTRRRARA